MKRTSPLLLLALAACTHAAPPGPAPVFSDPVVVNDLDGGFAQSEPSVVADSAGNVVVGWMDWTPPHATVHLSRSTDGGKTFGPSVPVHDPDPAHGVGQADVSLVRTAAGRIAASWLACRHDPGALDERACDVEWRDSLDAGKTWSPPRVLDAGGTTRRDRPWMATDGTGLYESWGEERAEGGPRWVAASLGSAGDFVVRSALDGRGGCFPLSAIRGDLETLVVDRSPGDLTKTVLDRVDSADGGRSFTSLGTITFDRSAVLTEFSLGSLALSPAGESWIAIPRGNGVSSDLTIARRPAGQAGYHTVGSLRETPGARVLQGWIQPLSRGRFLAAWFEEGEDGWRVKARILGPGDARSAAADVSRAAFQVQDASVKLKVGDFLSVYSTADRVWIAWGDSRKGDSDVRIAWANY